MSTARAHAERAAEVLDGLHALADQVEQLDAWRVDRALRLAEAHAQTALALIATAPKGLGPS